MPLFPPQGLIQFPGVDTFISGQYTLAHGITPGVATLIIPPQAVPPREGGPLMISFDDGLGWFGNSVYLEFSDCKIDQGTYRKSQQGFVWQLDILDRRWKWSFGEISGIYNAREADGEIVYGTEKTPQELATLLFDAMLETGYDVSLMPNDSRPAVVWDNDNPAQELAQLCEDLGCRVAPTLSNTFKVWPIGSGDPLPQSGGEPIMDGSASIDPPEVPDNIRVVCGQSKYQADLLLDAVGEDSDGELKLLDDLSYRPTKGWDPPLFNNVFDQFDKHAQKLAQQSVFRYYRLFENQHIPGYHSGEDYTASTREIMVLDGQLRSFSSNPDGSKVYEPSVIFGRWFDGNNLFSNTMGALTHLESPNNRYPAGGWKVDAKRRMVIFYHCVYALHQDKKSYVGAELFLRTTVAMRTAGTLAPVRYAKGEPSGLVYGTTDRIVKHYELIRTSIPTYEIDESDESVAGFNASVSNNEATLDEQIDAILEKLWAAYETETPLTLRYAGILPIEPNGVIQQVVWEVNGQGAFTVASQSQEWSRYSLSYQQRRQLERGRGLPERGKRFGSPTPDDGTITVFI